MRFLLAAFVLALIGAIFSFAPSTSPAADASCDPGRPSSWGNFHVGWTRPVSGVTGVKADIKEYDPHVEVAYSYSTAWVMLEAAGNWAQAGWRKSVWGRRVFAQWTDGISWSEDTRSPWTVGNFTRYEVLYSPTSNTFSFYSNAGAITPPKPAVFIPTHATISGEITNFANQMAGGYNPVSAERLYTSYYRGSDYLWRVYDWGDPGAEWLWNPPWTIVYFGLFQWSWWDLDIWDRACYD